MSKYNSFYDEDRPLRPIARRSDLTMLQTATELLHKSKDYNDDNDNQRDPRIPPIMSPSSTSST